MSVCAGPEGGWGKDDLQGLQAEQQEHAQLQVTKLKHCIAIAAKAYRTRGLSALSKETNFRSYLKLIKIQL